MTPQDLIDRALAAGHDDPARPLLVAAAIDLALGRSFVVVGGTAVNLHTGSYRPTDIDLVGAITPRDRDALTELGFRSEGRHLVLDSPSGAIPVEFPGGRLFEFATRPPDRIEVAPGIVVEVIALDDLMMDRLVQATDGSPVTRSEAVALAVAAYRRIDWAGLAERATGPTGVTAAAAEALPHTLGDVRRAARTHLRRGRRAAGRDEPRDS